jgi:hypothetical protein
VLQLSPKVDSYGIGAIDYAAISCTSLATHRLLDQRPAAISAEGCLPSRDVLHALAPRERVRNTTSRSTNVTFGIDAEANARAVGPGVLLALISQPVGLG